MDWCIDNIPYDLSLPGLCMPDFESSHIGLIISWADNCIAIEVANQKLGPSPACKPKLQQAGIYYLVLLLFYMEGKAMFVPSHYDVWVKVLQAERNILNAFSIM